MSPPTSPTSPTFPSSTTVEIEMSTTPRPVLSKKRHVDYWRRCLTTPLPSDYIPTDLNRMTLGCFSVGAVDLLGELPFRTSPEDRECWVEWIYRCQLPTGGFRGSPATDLGPLRTDSNAAWDPANVGASFFAVATLVNLGDDLGRVKRKELLGLLPGLQRDDGSFCESIVDEQQVGGRDMRFLYMAVALRWFLRGEGWEGRSDVADVDVERTVAYIRRAQTYDGGISEKPFGESHGLLFPTGG